MDAAWQRLMQHYLGPQHTQNQAAIYEAKLRKAHYEGESSRFTSAKYTTIHKDSHTISDGLQEHGYQGMDEGTKLRRFLNGIKTDKLIKHPLLAASSVMHCI